MNESPHQSYNHLAETLASLKEIVKAQVSRQDELGKALEELSKVVVDLRVTSAGIQVLLAKISESKTFWSNFGASVISPVVTALVLGVLHLWYTGKIGS